VDTREQGADGLEARRRVLLVDPRPERRALMRLVVETGQGGATVVAEAATADGAVAALDRYDVDTAVVEIQMPVAEGLASIASLRAGHPSLVIVVCSFHNDPSTRRQATVAGADAYLAKPVSPRDLHAACRGSAARAPELSPVG
jgi:DNA-binding NarL/FixJ family response regulator